MIEFPVVGSPFKIAQLIGAAPRYFGKPRCVQIDRASSRGFSTTGLAIFCPNAITTSRSESGSERALMLSVGITCKPALVAHCEIGVGVTPRPRPAGRSGWVTMRKISCPASRNAASVGMPNSPLPAKMIRSGVMKTSLSLAAKFLFQLFEFLPIGHLGNGSHAIGQQDSIEMVKLMLPDASGEASADLFEWVPFQVLRFECAHLPLFR